MATDFLALSLPPYAPGKLFPIPALPEETPPNAAAVVLLAGLVVGTVLAGLGQEPPKARKPHFDDKGKKRPDNTKVLKVFDAVEVVEKVLITDKETETALTAVIVRSFTKIYSIGDTAWHSIDDLIAN